MRHIHVRALATVAVAAFAFAACGSSSKTSSPAGSGDSTTAAPDTTAAPTTTTAPAAASVEVATTPLGKVLTDAAGLTLYRFDDDTTPGTSVCATDPCASTWPAATVTGSAVAGTGIDAAKLTTFARTDGSKQLQIDGHPLYRFVNDTKPGDTMGQGILDKWYAAGPDGDKVGDAS
jgi:predicted lipoprotein with Yx(FWY)xxD motif